MQQIASSRLRSALIDASPVNSSVTHFNARRTTGKADSSGSRQ